MVDSSIVPDLAGDRHRDNAGRFPEKHTAVLRDSRLAQCLYAWKDAGQAGGRYRHLRVQAIGKGRDGSDRQVQRGLRKAEAVYRQCFP